MIKRGVRQWFMGLSALFMIDFERTAHSGGRYRRDDSDGQSACPEFGRPADGRRLFCRKRPKSVQPLDDDQLSCAICVTDQSHADQHARAHSTPTASSSARRASTCPTACRCAQSNVGSRTTGPAHQLLGPFNAPAVQERRRNTRNVARHVPRLLRSRFSEQIPRRRLHRQLSPQAHAQAVLALEVPLRRPWLHRRTSPS